MIRSATNIPIGIHALTRSDEFPGGSDDVYPRYARFITFSTLKKNRSIVFVRIRNMPAKKRRKASAKNDRDAPPPPSASEEAPKEVPVEAAPKSPPPPPQEVFQVPVPMSRGGT